MQRDSGTTTVHVVLSSLINHKGARRENSPIVKDNEHHLDMYLKSSSATEG